VSPALAAAIGAAADLAWRPTYNIPGALAYRERQEAAQRLRDRLCGARLPANAPAELRFLVAAMRRVARCTFANRKGEPYYWRKRCVYELRGCLVVWQRSIEAVA
jgi:hypothetical protein